jgi:hypothetical protein
MGVPQKKAVEHNAAKDRNHPILQWDTHDSELVDQPVAKRPVHVTYFI